MWTHRQGLGELGLAGYAKEPAFTLRARGSHWRSKSGQRCDLHFQEIPLVSGEMSGGECREKSQGAPVGGDRSSQQGMKSAGLG